MPRDRRLDLAALAAELAERGRFAQVPAPATPTVDLRLLVGQQHLRQAAEVLRGTGATIAVEDIDADPEPDVRPENIPERCSAPEPLLESGAELFPDRPAPAPHGRGAAAFHEKSFSRKLSPIEIVKDPKGGRRPMPRAIPPYSCSTYVSIAATCPDTCVFKGAGCYVESGFTKFKATKLDAGAFGRTPADVILEEVALIDGAFAGRRVPQDGARGGRDLRLHVGGDAPDEDSARELGRAARRWRARGGGAVWTYTHRWREISRSAWGEELAVLASVEKPEELRAALDAGYAPAIVVAEFPGEKAFELGGVKVIPCPAETRERTCVDCRLCFDDSGLIDRRSAIGFALHGLGAGEVREQLVQVGARRKSIDVRTPPRSAPAAGQCQRHEAGGCRGDVHEAGCRFCDTRYLACDGHGGRRVKAWIANHEKGQHAGAIAAAATKRAEPAAPARGAHGSLRPKMSPRSRRLAAAELAEVRCDLYRGPAACGGDLAEERCPHGDCDRVYRRCETHGGEDAVDKVLDSHVRGMHGGRKGAHG